MYTILIVEDEPLELQALSKMVGTYTGHIGTILEARDSLRALALARNHTPDIIFMDINIPGQTGLEVVETLRRERYQGVIVILTAYGHFEYAQVALRLGVTDYLLKPIDREKLDVCLKNVFTKLEMTRKAKRQHSQLEKRLQDISAYMQPLALDALMYTQDAEETMRTLFDWPEDGMLQAFVLRFHFDISLSPDEQKCFYYDFCTLSSFQFSIVASVEESDIVFALQSLRTLPPTQLELTLWCIVVRMMQLLKKYDQVCTLTASPMVACYGDFIDFDQKLSEPSPKNPPLRLHALRRKLRSSTRIQQSKAVMRFKTGTPDRALSVFKSLLVNPDTQWAGIFCVLDALLEFNPATNVLDALHHVLDPSAPVAISLSDWLGKHVLTSAPEGISSSGFIIESALGIIQEEFDNTTLSQRDLAERLGLSQAYFSRLFKKEVGETFIARLTRIRMDHAKGMLDQGDPPSGIAEKCGYQSKKYFQDAFRQYYNLSVVQYLEGDESL